MYQSPALLSVLLPNAIPLPHTTIPLIVKAPPPITRTPSLLPRLLVARTVRIRIMLVPHIAEKVDLVLWQEQRSRDGVHRGVSPPLVVEPALRVEVVEEGLIGVATPEIEVSDLKVAPDCGELVS